ncbi:MAG TPA: SDR family oxidoreductase [Alphaproteobacteria bacterium]|nr:SDR family oxidoreductase [Alphaproteobacteria bacterium]
MRLQNKVAIITGAGSGFGEGMARRFVAEGAKVVVNDIHEANGRRVAAGLGKTAMFVKADVSKAADVQALAAAALSAHGRIDILVNNAGYTHRNQPLLDVPEDVFDRVFAVNVKALYLTALAAVPVMRRQGGGSILNTASTAGLRPRPGLTWYNASKGAVITMTKSMAAELASDRIRVNCLCPVAGETGMLADFMGGDTPENRARFRASVPLGRLSTPEDIANAALYLSSDEANFITGVALEVDGGRCI